jgi:proline iminopeptidase
MPHITANQLRFCYESFGEETRPAILLIMGLGVQMILWPDAFIEHLTSAGFRVIRFDNRDVGQSTHLAHLGMPNVPLAYVRFKLGLPVRAPYTLDDMAADTAALIDALGLERVHVVGASMGGMIGQSLAAQHPRKVASLTSWMSSTGRRSLPQPKWRTLRALLAPPGRTTEAAIRRMEHVFTVIGSRTHPAPAGYLREVATRHVLRSNDPAGGARQLMAIAAADDRSAAVARIRAPTLVIHGEEDPLILPEAGRDTARVINAGGGHAIYEEIRGMGHDFPLPLMPQVAARIAQFCRQHS